MRFCLKIYLHSPLSIQKLNSNSILDQTETVPSQVNQLNFCHERDWIGVKKNDEDTTARKTGNHESRKSFGFCDLDIGCECTPMAIILYRIIVANLFTFTDIAQS